MGYVALFAIVLPLQLLIVVTTLFLIRRRTLGNEAGSWLQLLGKVFLLLLVVNLVGMLPVIGLAAGIVWLVGLKRLSGLDVLRTLMLSCALGVVCFVILLVTANFLQLSMVGPPDT